MESKGRKEVTDKNRHKEPGRLHRTVPSTADTNSTGSIITLYVRGLNIPINRDYQRGSKNRFQPFGV